jgi:hypothetical protein
MKYLQILIIIKIVWNRPNLIGVIHNIKEKGVIQKIFNNRHWKTYRRFESVWYDLDSKLDQPYKFETFDHFLMKLSQEYLD